MTIHGSCLCTRVHYEISAPLTDVGNCHCSMCRKASGAAFLTYSGVAARHFRWTKGEDVLRRYTSSPGFNRVFCSRCGSTLVGEPTDPTAGTIWLLLGTLDDDPGATPSAHIFVGSKAPWFAITDALPQHQEFPG